MVRPCLKGNPGHCIYCKSYKHLCGLPRCPLVSSFIYRSKAISLADRGFIEGSTPPSLLVGELGYPRIRVYLGIPAGVKGDRASLYDNPSAWFGNLGLEDIMGIRSSIIFTSTRRFSAYEIPRLYNSELLLASISTRPVDTEAKVEKIVRPSVTVDYLTPPLGPLAIASDIKVTSNPSIPRTLEKTIK